MKDNVGQRAPAHRSPRQDPCFDPLIRSPVSRDSRAAASGSFLDWKGLGDGLRIRSSRQFRRHSEAWHTTPSEGTDQIRVEVRAKGPVHLGLGGIASRTFK